MLPWSSPRIDAKTRTPVTFPAPRSHRTAQLLSAHLPTLSISIPYAPFLYREGGAVPYVPNVAYTAAVGRLAAQPFWLLSLGIR
jgi:hypothetical protein